MSDHGRDGTDRPEPVYDEDGEPLTAPGMIDPETALEVVEALDKVLDDGDWWRLRKALQNRYRERVGGYVYTAQDRNLYDKFDRILQIREEKDEYERLRSQFSGAGQSSSQSENSTRSGGGDSSR